jgi:F-type H+-transporting ATPase subunit b
MLFFATVEHGNALFEIFDNNVINWLLLVALLAWLASKQLPGLFAARKTAIETTLKEASQARAEGVAFLEAQQTKIANAEKEAEKILVEAKQMAEQMRAQAEQQTKKELSDFAAKIEQQIAGDRQVAITQLRAAAAKAAVRLAEATLPAHLTDATRDRLMSQFFQQLEEIRN